MDAAAVRRMAALSGIALPEERTAALARDLAALAERLRGTPIRPDLDDDPAALLRRSQ